MDLPTTLEWQRVNAAAVNRLAKLGDALALKLIESYRALYADRLNPVKQTEFLKIADDYARRDLTDATRRILQDRWEHKIPKSYKAMVS